MRSKFKGKQRGAGFWDLIQSKKITLISNAEAPDSSLTAEEAAQFLLETKEKQRAEPERSAPVSAADDLMAEMD